MLKNLKDKSKSVFLRDVLTLASGTVISQIIVVVSSPILSRIYSVEAFGDLAIFTSLTSLFAVISTGRYELAIGLPEKEDDAMSIIQLIFIIASIVSIFYLILVTVLREFPQINDRTGFLKMKESYFAPIYIFIIAISSALSYWKQRKKKYKDLTIAVSLQVISTTVFSFIFAIYAKNYNGLIISLILGMVCSTTYFAYSEKKNIITYPNKKTILKNFNKYISFPKYMTVSDFSTVASQQIIPLIFSVLYSSTVVGFFSMANRIVRLPSIVITTSISNVFRNEAIEVIRLEGNCVKLYLVTFRKLLILSVLIYFFVFLSAPVLFKTFLGKQWEIAGDYARIISVFLSLEFISIPLNTVFNIRGKQKLLMNIQLANATIGTIVIFCGQYFFSSPYISLIFFCINSLIFNTLLIVFSYQISKSS